MNNLFANVSKIAKNEVIVEKDVKENKDQDCQTSKRSLVAVDTQKDVAVKAQAALVQHNIEMEQILPTPNIYLSKPPLTLNHATRNLNADLQNVLTEQNSIWKNM